MQKIEEIRRQQPIDWSALICEEASFTDLDQDALTFAREKYKEGNERSSFFEEIDSWDDETFLNKARLTLNGKITNTALLLLGKPETKRFLFPGARMSYIFFDEQGSKVDYEHFDPPFLLERDKLLSRIKNRDACFKLLPEDSLHSIEVQRFDSWSILEALNNCIAHQDYSKQSRIIVKEKANYELSFLSSGNFYNGSIEDYIFLKDFTPPKYRNQFLADAMQSIGMIDTIGSGIRRIFINQWKAYLPLPEYTLGSNVEVVIYGDGTWNNYTETLRSEPDLDLGKVFLLDKIQKGHSIDDQDYRYTIISFLKQKRRAGKKDFDELLINTLPEELSEAQRKKKIGNLLQSLSRDKKIRNISKSTKKPIWTLLS